MKSSVKAILLSLSCLSVLAACQNSSSTDATSNSAPTSSSQMAETQSSQTTSQSQPLLAKGVWEEKLYDRLVQLIQEYGKQNPNYDENKKPYAVFDWDNTTIINDIGEATFTYQIQNLAFKMTPDQFDVAVRKNLPLDNFGEDWNNKEGNPVNIEGIAADLVADYTYLYQNYQGFEGTQSLEEIKESLEYKDFAAKLRYLYEAVGDSFSSDISYPWVIYLYTGFTSEEVRQLTELSIDYALQDTLEKVTWESPEDLPGQAGQVSVSFKTGIRSVEEMQNLYASLMENGIDVYICSASYYDVIFPYATNPKYGYNIDEDKITAMRMAFDENGKIMTQLDENYAQTQGAGKTKTIQDLIAPKYENRAPIMIAGDSNGDYAMLTDFELEVGIIFNRLKDTSKGIGSLSKIAVDSYEDQKPTYYLQGRDENEGHLLPGRETILLGKSDKQLLPE